METYARVVADSIAPSGARLTTMELWMDIPGYEGFYQASSFGRVRSCDRIIGHVQKQHARVWKGKILSPNLVGRGYPAVSISMNGCIQRAYVHRLVALAFVSNPENKDCVNHKDGNKLNNCVDNLEWCTNQENQKHAYDNRLSTVPKKLDKAKVNEIRELLTNRVSQYKIAEQFGITQSQVSNIKRGVSWNDDKC